MDYPAIVITGIDPEYRQDVTRDLYDLYGAERPVYIFQRRIQAGLSAPLGKPHPLMSIVDAVQTRTHEIVRRRPFTCILLFELQPNANGMLTNETLMGDCLESLANARTVVSGWRIFPKFHLTCLTTDHYVTSVDHLVPQPQCPA